MGLGRLQDKRLRSMGNWKATGTKSTHRLDLSRVSCSKRSRAIAGRALPLEKEEARDPGLALVPLFVPVLAVPLLENLHVEVAVLALLDRRVETLEALIADGDTDRAHEEHGEDEETGDHDPRHHQHLPL